VAELLLGRLGPPIGGAGGPKSTVPSAPGRSRWCRRKLSAMVDDDYLDASLEFSRRLRADSGALQTSTVSAACAAFREAEAVR
jgi:hypothetical protein